MITLEVNGDGITHEVEGTVFVNADGVDRDGIGIGDSSSSDGTW